jgi:hypothetical protein
MEDAGSSLPFPRVEWLGDSDHQKALEWVARRKNMDRYRSRVDFVCMEVFPELQYGRWRYYRDEGPPLRELLEPEDIARREQVLLCALAYAYATFKENRRVSWTRFRCEALRLVA